MKTEDLGAAAPLTRKTREYRALLALEDAVRHADRWLTALLQEKTPVEALGCAARGAEIEAAKRALEAAKAARADGTAFVFDPPTPGCGRERKLT